MVWQELFQKFKKAWGNDDVNNHEFIGSGEWVHDWGENTQRVETGGRSA